MENFKGSYITHLPLIHTYDLDSNSLGFVLGSDGLWDELTPDQVTKIYEQNSGSSQNFLNNVLLDSLKNAAHSHKMNLKKLQKIKIGIKRQYHDDITLLFVDLKNQVTE